MRIGKTRPLAMFIASTLMAATISVAIPGTAFADDSVTTTTEVAAALDEADAKDNALVATAAQSTTDGDSAAQTAIVDIPADPVKGVKFTTKDGKVLTIGVPDAKRSGKGHKTRKGVVAYVGKGGSANAVVPTADGVQFLTTIESRRGATKFDYPITVPEGGKIELLPNGWAATVNADGGSTGVFISPAWARDAKGKSVKSWFTTDGKVLTQHVQHRVSGVTYPVVADPSVGDILWAVVRCGAGGWLGWVAAAFTPYGILLRAMTVAASCVVAL